MSSLPTMTTPETTSQTRTRDARSILFLLAAAVIAADQASKRWIVHHIHSGTERVLIPKYFALSHVLNSGAAFSAFADSASPETVRRILIGFSVAAAIIVAALIVRTGRTLTFSSVALALILGGAIGNLYDRIRYGYVIDFLEVHIVHYHWPDFNLADSCIVIGACLLILEIFRPQPSTSSQPSS